MIGTSELRARLDAVTKLADETPTYGGSDLEGWVNLAALRVARTALAKMTCMDNMTQQTENRVTRLIRISEAAERLAMSPAGVRRATVRGDIRSVRIGRRVLIPESEIDRLIASAS